MVDGGILVNVLMEGTTKSALNGQWIARKSPLTLWNGFLIWWWVSGHGPSLLLIWWWWYSSQCVDEGHHKNSLEWPVERP